MATRVVQKKRVPSKKAKGQIPYFDDIIAARKNRADRVLGVLIDHVSFDASAVGHNSQPKGVSEVVSLVLIGKTYYGEGVTSAEITFGNKSAECPAPSYDEDLQRIKLYLSESEFFVISSILSKSKYVLCIYWESQSMEEKGVDLYTYDPL